MSGKDNKKLISVVVPCFNEAEVIDETIRRLKAIVDSETRCDFELIFVDDGSTDPTLTILKQHVAQYPRIRVITLSRNFGHQIAVTAGIEAATGDAVVLIDADLQDPPELIPKMVDKWQRGYDVVFATREFRLGESRFKVSSARLFYRFLNRLSEVPIPLDTGDFRLMSRRVVNSLKSMPEQGRFIRGMVAWVGFKQTSIQYERSPRFAGDSKYPLKKMLTFALDGILSFSNRPLRIATYFGLFCSVLALSGAIYMICVRSLDDHLVAGWASTMFTILFLGGVQLVTLGVLGEYVGRIYREVKSRPLYFSEEYDGQVESE